MIQSVLIIGSGSEPSWKWALDCRAWDMSTKLPRHQAGRSRRHVVIHLVLGASYPVVRPRMDLIIAGRQSREARNLFSESGRFRPAGRPMPAAQRSTAPQPSYCTTEMHLKTAANPPPPPDSDPEQEWWRVQKPNPVPPVFVRDATPSHSGVRYCFHHGPQQPSNETDGTRRKSSR